MNSEMQLLTLKDFLKRGARYSAPATQEESQGSIARTDTPPSVDLTFCEDVGSNTTCDEDKSSKPGLAEGFPPLPPRLHSAEKDGEQQEDLSWICVPCLWRFLEDICGEFIPLITKSQMNVHN